MMIALRCVSTFTSLTRDPIKVNHLREGELFSSVTNSKYLLDGGISSNWKNNVVFSWVDEERS